MNIKIYLIECDSNRLEYQSLVFYCKEFGLFEYFCDGGESCSHYKNWKDYYNGYDNGHLRGKKFFDMYHKKTYLGTL